MVGMIIIISYNQRGWRHFASLLRSCLPHFSEMCHVRSDKPGLWKTRMSDCCCQTPNDFHCWLRISYMRSTSSNYNKRYTSTGVTLQRVMITTLTAIKMLDVIIKINSIIVLIIMIIMNASLLIRPLRLTHHTFPCRPRHCRFPLRHHLIHLLRGR